MNETPTQIMISFPREDEHLFDFLKRFETTALKQGWNKDQVYKVFDKAFWYSYHHTLDTIMDHCCFDPS